MSSKGKRRLIAVGVVVMAAGVALILIGVFGRARICGATPDERITSICRLADAKPFGAGDALAEAAASVEYLKTFPGVQEAFRKAGLRLVRRPEYRYVHGDDHGVHQGRASERP